MAAAEPVTVAAFGDSLTAGYGLPPEDGFVPQLQDWLDGQGAEVVLVNAGLPGDTTAGGLSRLDWTLTDEVDALILALGSNDYLRGLPPEQARDNLDAMLAAATDRGLPVLLVGVEAGGNFGADYKAAFDAIYPALADSYGVPLYPSFYAPVLDIVGAPEALTPYLQEDGLHPTAEAVAIIVAGIGPAVLDLVQQVR